MFFYALEIDKNSSNLNFNLVGGYNSSFIKVNATSILLAVFPNQVDATLLKILFYKINKKVRYLITIPSFYNNSDRLIIKKLPVFS